MGPIDALWHLLNLLAPAAGLGLLLPALAKLLWRQSMRQVRWWPLAVWAMAAAALVTVSGLVITGQDGRMATHTTMVLAVATVVWWRGLRGR